MDSASAGSVELASAGLDLPLECNCECKSDDHSPVIEVATVNIETADGHIINAPITLVDRLNALKLARIESGLIPVKCTRETFELYLRMPDPPKASVDPEEPDQLSIILANANEAQLRYIATLLSFRSTDGIDRTKLECLSVVDAHQRDPSTGEMPPNNGEFDTLKLMNDTAAYMPANLVELAQLCHQYNNRDCQVFMFAIMGIFVQMFDLKIREKIAKHPDNPDNPEYNVEELPAELAKFMSGEEFAAFMTNGGAKP